MKVVHQHQYLRVYCGRYHLFSTLIFHEADQKLATEQTVVQLNLDFQSLINKRNDTIVRGPKKTRWKEHTLHLPLSNTFHGSMDPSRSLLIKLHTLHHPCLSLTKTIQFDHKDKSGLEIMIAMRGRPWLTGQVAGSNEQL